MKHSLTIDSVELQFGDRKILRDVFIEIKTGEVIGLVGRNGEGKSSLMNIIYGTQSAQHSIMRIDNQTIKQAYLEKGMISYLPQFNFIPKSFTLGRVFKDFDLAFSEFLNCFPEFNQNERTKIKHLSGGYRRIMEIYIIIKAQTLFAILDEPFSALMPLHIEKVIDLIQREKSKKGFLISDHNYEKVFEISTELLTLNNGKTHQVNDIENLKRLGHLNPST